MDAVPRSTPTEHEQRAIYAVDGAIGRRCRAAERHDGGARARSLERVEAVSAARCMLLGGAGWMAIA